MLRFRYQNRWEIFLAIYRCVSEFWSIQSALLSKGEIVTFMSGKCLVWLACTLKPKECQEIQAKHHLHRDAWGSLWAKIERLEVKTKLSIHTDIKRSQRICCLVQL